MADGTQKIGTYRYRILALVFLATTINYFDRSIIGVLAPTLQKIFDWSNQDYSYIVMSFKVAYGLGLFFIGNVIDKFGTRIGYTISIGIWALFGMLHAAVRPAFSLIGFMMARFGLGIGESGNFPAAIKTVAEWFPKKDRAFANGIFDASTSIGAIMAPWIVWAIVDRETGKYWQIPFLFTGVLSSIWVILWLRTYRKPELHPKLSKAELEYINSDSEAESIEGKIPLRKLLPRRETWAFAITTITDAVWWFYLFWGAKFLVEQFGMDINLGVPYLIIYLLADAGSLLGGWTSGALIKKGWSINKARKITMLISAIIILPVSFVAVVESQFLAFFLIGFGAAGHQSWSITSYTLVPDVFPKKAVASVIGMGKTIGVVVAILADFALGAVLDTAGNSGYFWAFVISGSSYLVIFGFVHLLMPHMTPLDDDLNYIRK